MFFIIFTDFSSAVQIGISPPQIDFKGVVGEKICKNITLFSTQKEEFTGSDKWTNVMKSFKDIKMYNRNSSVFNITLQYPLKLIVKERSEIEMCVIGNISGEYYGAIIYNTNKSVAVGSWIVFKAYNNNNFYEETDKRNILTGKTITLQNNIRNKTHFLFLNFILAIILTFVLFMLFQTKRKTNY